MATTLAFVECRDGRIRRISHETLTAGRELADAAGGDLHALVIAGSRPPDLESLGGHGADIVHTVEGQGLDLYQSAAYTSIVSELIRDQEVEAVVIGGSALGKDLGPRVAARLGAGYAADCTEIGIEDGSVVATRPIYAGKVFARVRLEQKPAVVTIRPNVFSTAAGPGRGEVAAVVPHEVETGLGAIVREVRAAAGRKLDVGEAAIVVSGGRGLREPSNFAMLEELAEVLGGAVGASRAVVDEGWRPHAEQVGQTGKTVSPQLYFAIGISGAIQHLAGMRTARTIVAINKDPDAPIFRIADYGIVGDLFEIVPRLIEEIRKLRQSE